MSSSLHSGSGSGDPISRKPQPAKKYLGASKQQWIEYLIAILLGNAIYYLSLQPHLPGVFQHKGFSTDWGLLVDFAVCAAVYGLIRLGWKVNAGK
jgi:hypothetical protein